MTVSLLNAVTPVLAVLALVSTILAMSTNTWLHTEERLRNHNRTVKFGPGSQPEHLIKRTTSGLLAICVSKVDGLNLTCTSISYFPTEKYQPDDQDSTHAIPYSARNSAIYFLLSFIFLLIGELFCLVTILNSSKKIFAFFSGISFVIGGLITLVGMINYISIFKAEVGNKLYSRSEFTEPAFTYRYGYSFAMLILSFLISELSGICAIFQFIYHHQYKWDQIEKNNVVENSVAGLGGGGDPGSCKIVATLSNGTIKTLCDTKETLSMTEDLTQLMDRRLDPSNDISHLMDRRLDPSKDLTQLMDRRLDPSKDPSQLTNGRLGPSKDPSQMSPSLRLVQPSHPPPPQSQSLHHSLHTDCNCSYPLYSDQALDRGQYMAAGGGSIESPGQLVFVPRQATVSSITTDTTGFSSSLCSPSYPGPAWGEPKEASSTTSINTWVASLKVPGPEPHQGAGQGSSGGSDTSEERRGGGRGRGRVTRHISIDDTPITHTYHQPNSLDTSSDSSHSPEEDHSSSPDSSHSQSSSQPRPSPAPGPSHRAGPGSDVNSTPHCSTLPSRNKRILKSSLSKTSSLKKTYPHKFEPEENLQQIVKQKRENCLQNGLSLSRESIDDVFEENTNIISQV